MRKIAIFVEGETELIFVRRLLDILIDHSILKYECVKLLSGYKTVRTPRDFSSPNPQIYFLLTSVGNDCRVLDVIKNSEKKLIADSFDTIIGLRDMYSQQYKKLSSNIDESVTKQFIDKSNETIRKMNNPSKIKLHFAIMEIEAWFLAFHKIFEKIDRRLTVQFIKERLHFGLQQIDPQTAFFKPSNELSRLFKLVNVNYKKSRSNAEMIVSKIDKKDLEEANSSSKISSFVSFYSEIKNLSL